MHDPTEPFPTVAFLRALNHELRSHVRAVSGSVGVAWEELDGLIPAAAIPWKQRADDGISTLAQLLEDISDLTSVAQAPVNPQRVSIESVIDRSLKRLRVPSEQVIVDCPVETVAIDAGLVEVIIRELLSNALKFQRRGEEAVVGLKASEADGRLLFEVKDSGIGIDSQFLDQIFGAFERLHPAHAYPGSGLGLFKARLAAGKIGASIRLVSEPAVGTTATVTIPTN